MKKKIFDIRAGHYILTEDDSASVSTDTTQQTSGEKQNQEQQPKQQNALMNKSVETSPDIQKVNADVEAENKRYSDSKVHVQTTYTTQKTAAEDAVNSALAAAGRQYAETSFDSVQTNPAVIAAKKKMLDIDLKYAEDMAKVEVEHAKNIHRIESGRLQIISNMNNENLNRLPAKYRRFLNESNIHQAKIYMGTLVQNDDEHIIKDMNDFKRVFRDSALVYGKDKNGYYTLCIDQEDFDKLYNTLQEAGYMRDEIFAVVMPQVLDRSSMIDSKK